MDCREVPGFPEYLIYEDGTVYRKIFVNNVVRKILDEPRKVKPYMSRGYPRVALSRNGKTITRFTHTLVLITFIGEQPEGCEASHLDGNRKNSHRSNLIWETRKENHARKALHGTVLNGEKNPHCSVSAAVVSRIKGLSAGGMNRADIVAQTGINYWTVRDIVAGRRRIHG